MSPSLPCTTAWHITVDRPWSCLPTALFYIKGVRNMLGDASGKVAWGSVEYLPLPRQEGRAWCKAERRNGWNIKPVAILPTQYLLQILLGGDTERWRLWTNEMYKIWLMKTSSSEFCVCDVCRRTSVDYHKGLELGCLLTQSLSVGKQNISTTKTKIVFDYVTTMSIVL